MKHNAHTHLVFFLKIYTPCIFGLDEKDDEVKSAILLLPCHFSPPYTVLEEDGTWEPEVRSIFPFLLTYALLVPFELFTYPFT